MCLKMHLLFNRFMTNVAMEMKAFKKATGNGSFKQTQETIILK